MSGSAPPTLGSGGSKQGRVMTRSISVRLSVGTLCMIVLLGVTWLAATVGTNALRANYVHTVDSVDALTTAVLRASTLRDDEETGLRGYLLRLCHSFDEVGNRSI